jgi:hypothetical protein
MKIIIDYDEETNKMKLDFGEKEYPIFIIINILAECIQRMSEFGYKKEEELWEEKNKNDKERRT